MIHSHSYLVAPNLQKDPPRPRKNLGGSEGKRLPPTTVPRILLGSEYLELEIIGGRNNSNRAFISVDLIHYLITFSKYCGYNGSENLLGDLHLNRIQPRSIDGHGIPNLIRSRELLARVYVCPK
jgi:hypothetical protein